MRPTEQRCRAKRPAHRLAHALITLAAALTLGLVTTGTAAADGEGVTTWGDTVLNGLPVAGGLMVHDTRGKGTVVTQEYVAVKTYQICNYWTDFNFYDVSGRWYWNIHGPTTDRCTQNAYQQWDAPGGSFQARTGRVCAELWSNGHRLAKQCNSIHP